MPTCPTHPGASPWCLVAMVAVVAGATSTTAAQGRDAANDWIRPRALEPGDAIGFVAPAGPAAAEPIRAYAQQLEKAGYRVIIPEGIEHRKRGYLGGSDEERAAELNRMIHDPQVRAIFPVCGGYGLTRILDRIDYAALRHDPKIVTGYSDLTALHLAISRKARVVTFLSPMPMHSLWRGDRAEYAFANGSFRRAVFADQYPRGAEGYVIATAMAAATETSPAPTKKPEPASPPEKLVGGTARGRLIGGNLTLICATMGTPYELEPSGAILVIEDTNEAPYRVDRMLSQLRLAGILGAVSGVVVGSFSPADHPDAREIDRVLRESLGGLKVPVLMGFPVGHTPRNATIPIGCRAELDADRGVIRLLENPVRVD